MLTASMRASTHELHSRAERSGIVNDILRGKVSRHGYALLLRNLLPAYEQLEAGLEIYRHVPPACAAAQRELYRAPSIRSDLDALYGDNWELSLMLLPSAENYARRVATAARGDGAALIAHAYTRYFGDLNGGQVLKRLLARAPGLQPDELSFYDFPDIADLDAFKERYRQGIDDYAAGLADASPVVAEAVVAFELNIAVSQEVQQASATVS